MFETIKRWIFGRPPPPRDFITRLTPVSQFEVEVNDLGLFLISSAVFVSSKTQITADRLTWSLRRLMAIHPLLRMRVGVHDGQWWWREMAALEPDVRVDTSRDWHEAFSRSTDETYDIVNGPLWRVTLFPDVTSEYCDVPELLRHHCCLVMGFNHAIIDGTGKLHHAVILFSLSLSCTRTYMYTYVHANTNNRHVRSYM